MVFCFFRHGKIKNFYYCFFDYEWHFIHLFSLWLKLWEFQINILARGLLIHTRKSFNLCSACSAELCLNEPLGADCHPFTWSIHSFTWEEQVPKDGVMYSCQGAAFGCFCLFFCTFFLSWLGQNLPRAVKTACLPLNFFSNHEPARLGFSGKISAEKLVLK